VDWLPTLEKFITRCREGKFLESVPTVSVIIPTFNRKDSLQRTLDSIGYQTFPVDRFEVIVVDDGSTDDSQTVASQQFPFTLRYERQKNQGATAARNLGATISESEILVFIDDDVTISPQTLEALAETCCQKTNAIVVGKLVRRWSDNASVYAEIVIAPSDHALMNDDDVDLHFTDCNTELLACKRSDFLDLGMLQDPTGGYGWPNWDDVDFGYRAHLNGFRLLQSSKAIGEHWDHSITDQNLACQRWYRASRSAVWLFKRHQELKTLIPMLYDKTPLAWGQDSPLLIARKLARSLLSTQPVLGCMVNLVNVLEHYYPSPVVLRHLYYWLQGAYMYQGYREGLRAFELVGAKE
jgi:glycosyltransferase involved in cell wall biosynthesis